MLSACATPEMPEHNEHHLSHAMILCAGIGQRLRPLTLELPKPLLPVGDRSLLAHISAALARAGHFDAAANTHWMPEQFQSILADLPITLTLVHEPLIRGVAGGISGARGLLEAPLVVYNGDIAMWEPPLREVVDVARDGDGVCLAVSPARDGGTVGLDASGRVVRLRGERHGVEVRSGDYVGLAGFSARALGSLPVEGCLIGDVCLPLLRRGEPVYSCPAPSEWWDIGSVQGYLAANRAWLARHANQPQQSFVHPSARVAAAVSVDGCVIGAGAEVLGQGSLSGCVVWPQARALAPLSNSVVTPKQVMPGNPRALP